MFPGLNPKKMQAMMKKMGIAQQSIPANKVIIEKDDGNIIIENPSIVKINMQGQTNFQISGDISKEGESEEEDEDEETNLSEEQGDTTQEDIKTIIEKTNCLEQEAKIAYEKADKDLAEAILSLS